MLMIMLPYWAMFRSRFREELQYRAAAFAGIVTQVVFGFIFLMVLLAFYESSEVKPPLTPMQTAAYIWLGQAFLGMLPWNVDPAALNAIRTGEVVNELLRPVDTYRFWYARAMAWRVVRTGLRCVPMVVLAMGVFPLVGLGDLAMPVPASVEAFGLFCVATVLAAFLSVAITLFIQVLMLWTVSPDGLLRVLLGLIVVFSGNLIPLPMWPDWMQPFLAVQPFRGLVDTPCRIYSGDLSGIAALEAMGWSVGWLVVLVVLGMWILRKGMSRLAVAGG